MCLFRPLFKTPENHNVHQSSRLGFPLPAQLIFDRENCIKHPPKRAPRKLLQAHNLKSSRRNERNARAGSEFHL